MASDRATRIYQRRVLQIRVVRAGNAVGEGIGVLGRDDWQDLQIV